MERTDRSVAVVGAGIGGLAAALALRSAGFAVRVYEREAQSRDLGFALLLAPNAMSALRELGQADAIVTAGAAARRGEIRRLDGKTLRRIDSTRVTERLGEPAIVALRPVLHGALLEAVGEEALVLGRRATGCTASEAGATVHFEGGEHVRARIVVAPPFARRCTPPTLRRSPAACSPYAVSPTGWAITWESSAARNTSAEASKPAS
jgi:2-polyprenyl-6-methoxyphenol hydroxylase-like FAD-dependent oxidoreductase